MKKVLAVMKKVWIVMKKVTAFLLRYWEVVLVIAFVTLFTYALNIKDAVGRGAYERQLVRQSHPEIDTAWYTNNPSAESFEISTAAGLAGLAALVNRTGSAVDFAGKTVRLVKDIDLSEHYGATFNRGRGWIPIGDYAFVLDGSNYRRHSRYDDNDEPSIYYKVIHSHVFKGIFDGNGKVVRGLYIKDSRRDRAGLFGQIAGGAEVKNLGVVDANVMGHRYIGAIAGHVDSGGSVANCYSTGAVSGYKSLLFYSKGRGGRLDDEWDSYCGHIGGVIGHTSGNVTNCYSTCAVSNGKGGPYSSGESNHVGGVVGSTGPNSNVINSYSTGAVSGNERVGGVIGSVDSNSNVTNCYSTSAVSGSNQVGGVVGSVGPNSNVTNCYSTSAVSGSNQVGGVVGSAGSKSSVANCVALNLSVAAVINEYSGSRSGTDRGRVAGATYYSYINPPADTLRTELSGNLAFRGTTNENNNANWDNRGANKKDGAGITAIKISADGTLNGLFTDTSNWVTQNGKLPGFGAAVDMPEHLSPNIPNITKQPSSGWIEIGEAGATHNLTVAANTAEGGELSYQWYATTTGRDTGGTAIVGATDTTYAAQIDTAGTRHYYAVVTNRFTDSLGVQQTAATKSFAVMLRVVLFTNPDTAWYANDTGATSFEISTADELVGLAALVNRQKSAVHFAGKTIKLVNDIDLLSSFDKRYTDGNGWIPIGSQGSFNGIFDGNGKTISGVYINDSTLSHAGLFGTIGGYGNSVIKNLGVVGVSIKGNRNVGGIVGYISGSNHADSGNVVGCYSTGVIVGNRSVGGIVGASGDYGKVINCYSTASVSGHTNVGGMVGGISGGSSGFYGGYGGHITNCYSTGAVTGEDNVGGIVGMVSSARVINCAALNPSVECPDSWVFGRIVGKHNTYRFRDKWKKLSGNIAFRGITNVSGKTAWRTGIANTRNGTNITAAKINSDATIGSLFADTSIWTTQPGKLPGLGAPVEMPTHLKITSNKEGKKK